MALTSARDILNKKILGTGGVPSAEEIPIDIEGLSASKLSVGLEEIVLDINQLSASVLTIGEKVENATTYSSDEEIVGKWFNKTLYKKTIHIAAGLTINQDAWGDVATLDEQIFVVKCEGVQDTGTETSFYNLGANCDTDKKLTVWNYRTQSTTVHYITIYYYKNEVTESKKRTTRKSTK